MCQVGHQTQLPHTPVDCYSTFCWHLYTGKAGVTRGIQSVSEDHLTYYEVVTKAILASDSAVLKVQYNV